MSLSMGLNFINNMEKNNRNRNKRNVKKSLQQISKNDFFFE